MCRLVLSFYYILGPFNVSVMSYMRLTNPSDKKILFKIKTTAPKKYCVRPNSGALDPKHTIEVASKYIYNYYFLHAATFITYCIN